MNGVLSFRDISHHPNRRVGKVLFNCTQSLNDNDHFVCILKLTLHPLPTCTFFTSFSSVFCLFM